MKATPHASMRWSAHRASGWTSGGPWTLERHTTLAARRLGNGEGEIRRPLSGSGFSCAIRASYSTPSGSPPAAFCPGVSVTSMCSPRISSGAASNEARLLSNSCVTRRISSAYHEVEVPASNGACGSSLHIPPDPEETATIGDLTSLVEKARSALAGPESRSVSWPGISQPFSVLMTLDSLVARNRTHGSVRYLNQSCRFKTT